jgi:predicted anti-sigma-YlaC factor YlaD
MTDAGACEEIRLELGVYLLGAIGTADRSAVEDHLACCPDCRNMLAELAGLPGLLNRVPASDPGLTVDVGPVGAPESQDRDRRKTVPFRARRAITGKQHRKAAR